MKHPLGLILLFTLSAGSSIFHLIRSYMVYPVLEKKVANALRDFLLSIPEDIDIEALPEWCAIGCNEAFMHLQEWGIIHFYLKIAVALLIIAAVLLMIMHKRVGYTLYVISQVVGLLTIFIGYGVNSITLLAGLLYALFAGLFIRLYYGWFFKRGKNL